MKLWHGDCLELMQNIPDKSVDCCITDPPYGTTACKWDTVIPFEPMWKELKRIVKDNGAICLFGTEPFSSHLRLSNLKMFKYDWIWKKSNPTGFAIAKKQPMRNHESISIFYKKQCSYFYIKEPRECSNKSLQRWQYKKSYTKNKNNIHNIKNVAHENVDPLLRFPTTIKFFKSRDSYYASHPTQKPVALLEYLIKTYTLENETVLDFTMGSGSTGVACTNLGREFIGIEKEKKYFDIACQRIKEAQEEKFKPKINPLFEE